MKFRHFKFLSFVVALACVTIGCESDDPDETSNDGGSMAAGGEPGTGGEPATGGTTGMGGMAMDCMPHPEDYPGDSWGTCISDEGAYEVINPSISSIARIASFETIADTLWRREGAPSTDDFTTALTEYTANELLDSRVQRRYDSHYPAPEDGSSCRDPGVPEMSPDYCVGPASILPTIMMALNAGIAGEDAAANAARVEASLLWFFYVSAFKEANSCASKSKDCDSAWAYYTGGEQVDGGLGLSKYVREIEPATHQAVFNGILAIRCWREQDNDPMSSSQPEVHQRALRQLDSALDRALAAVLIDRLNTWNGSDAAAWAFLQVLGPVADRAVRAIDPAKADTLAAAWAGDGSDQDAATLAGHLNDLFPCP